MKMQVLFTLVVLAFATLASAKTPAQIYCGRRLANVLAYLCREDDFSKRSGNYIDYDNVWPWTLSKSKALEAARGKREGGVATECCDKPCTQSELLSYC